MFGSTSASQYLHPDYLSPLPTTLDAKKSPLALLAQTCNSIGKDISPGRPMPKTPSSSSSTSSSSSFSTASSSKDSTKEMPRCSASGDTPWKAKDEPLRAKEDLENGDQRSIISSSPPQQTLEDNDRKTPQAASAEPSQRCVRTGSAGRSFSSVAASGSGPSDHRSISGGGRKVTLKEKPSGTGQQKSGSQSIRSSSGLSSSSSSSSSPKTEAKGTDEAWPDRLASSPHRAPRFSSSESDGGRSSSHRQHDQKPPRNPEGNALGSAEPFAHLRIATTTCSPTMGDCLSPLVLNYLAGKSHYQGHQLLSSADALSKFSSPNLSAYLAYLQTRVGLPPCKDPFCTECPPPPLPFSSLGLFEKTFAAAAGSHPRPPYALQLHERPCPSGSVSLDALSALYSGSLVGSPISTSGVPNYCVCPWLTPDGEYCGKRCASAEDLLLHTRSHWPPPSSRGAAALSLPSALGFHSLPEYIGYHPCYPFSPSSLSLLRQTYGSRNQSQGGALFSLGAASSRFHPYKSPSASGSLSSPSLSFDLYPSQRTMGAAAP